MKSWVVSALLFALLGAARAAELAGPRAVDTPSLPALPVAAAALNAQAASDAALLAPAAAALEARYVEPVDRGDLYEAALRGLAAEAGQQDHPDVPIYAAALRQVAPSAAGPAGLDGERLFDGSILLRGVEPDLPADKAGLRAGDRIVGTTAGAALARLSSPQAKDALRRFFAGEHGLLVVRDGAQRVLPARGHAAAVTDLFHGALRRFAPALQREAALAALRALGRALDPFSGVIPARAADGHLRRVDHGEGESVSDRLLAGGVGYVRLARFTKGSAARLAEAIDGLRQRGARRVILDLRGNPGGLHEETLEAASLFLPHGSLISVAEERGRPAAAYRTEGAPRFAGLPLRILIDRGSASASEMLAGAAREHGAATLYGEESRGKGSVQEIWGLGGGAYLKATVGRWRLPSGRVLSPGKGLRPDVAVPADAALDSARNW